MPATKKPAPPSAANPASWLLPRPPTDPNVPPQQVGPGATSAGAQAVDAFMDFLRGATFGGTQPGESGAKMTGELASFLLPLLAGMKGLKVMSSEAAQAHAARVAQHEAAITAAKANREQIRQRLDQIVEAIDRETRQSHVGQMWGGRGPESASLSVLEGNPQYARVREEYQRTQQQIARLEREHRRFLKTGPSATAIEPVLGETPTAPDAPDPSAVRMPRERPRKER